MRRTCVQGPDATGDCRPIETGRAARWAPGAKAQAEACHLECNSRGFKFPSRESAAGSTEWTGPRTGSTSALARRALIRGPPERPADGRLMMRGPPRIAERAPAAACKGNTGARSESAACALSTSSTATPLEPSSSDAVACKLTPGAAEDHETRVQVPQRAAPRGSSCVS